VSDSLSLSETCKFKLEPTEEQKRILEELFSTYRSMVEECLKGAISMNITSRKRLHESIHGELRRKLRDYPSHHIYSAMPMFVPPTLNTSNLSPGLNRARSSP
jgi:predicted transposase